jgi:hypothetical protein
VFFPPRASRARLGPAALWLALWPAVVTAQVAAADVPAADSVAVAAGPEYQAGGFYRFLFGNTYRDLWTTPVRVAVLNLHTFNGGLRPVKEGGGNQTKSLRLITPDGVEYVFRLVDKTGVKIPPRFKGTIVEHIARDQISAGHPAGALVAAPILAAAGVLHVTPVLAVMPDDPLLGEFQADFAGRLGMIEQVPSTPKHAAGFAGAVEIIDSDTLLARLDRDPRQRIDAHALLAARLMDMLFNDWDRHSGQWKWARMASGPTTMWLPIPRDRDKAFVSYGGLMPGLARLASPNVMSFESSYPSVRGLTWNSIEFDRRLLGGLEKPVWDSVAAALVGRVTDRVIDDAMLALPPEYRRSAPELARKLKRRRDGLPGAAERFYSLLAAVADVHATDAADRATVTRLDDRLVEVRLESGGCPPYFLRRFDRRETREIRIYLHGGDDTALVTGNVRQSIPVRIIGGNGRNRLLDSSQVGGSRDPARLDDTGKVRGVRYGPDTLYNRRPWTRENGVPVPPGPDRGRRFSPVIGLGVGDLGGMFRLGINQNRYGFGKRPYATRIGVEAEYAAGFGGFRIGAIADHRREDSPVHFTLGARMSQLEVTSFHGFGNATADGPTAQFEVRQRQWLLQPSVALSLAPRSELSLGPVLQYSTTGSTQGRFIQASRPYGFGHFGQAGLQLTLHSDLRDQPRDPHRGAVLDLGGSLFPAVWDVKTPFGEITAGATAYLTLPIPAHPTLALRAGARKLFGAYPFHEAAFIGGSNSVRTLDPQRYAGDASLAGTAELRLPLARFPLILPLVVGVFGFTDAGRVYVDGDSPGGWHTAAGGGFWVGLLDPSTAITVTLTNGPRHAAVLIRTGLTF